MRIVIAGAHGQIARRLGRLLTARGDTVVGHHPQSRPRADVVADGVDARGRSTSRPRRSSEVAGVLDGADAVVFAAGAGPGSGPTRKDTVDRGAAVLLADAAERCRRRALPAGLLDGRGQRRRRATPEGHRRRLRRLPAGEAAPPRTRSCRARSGRRRSSRPGGLTDDPGTGRVTLGPGRSSSGQHPPGRRGRRARRAPGRRHGRTSCSSWSAGPPRSTRRSRDGASLSPGGRG